MKRGRPVGSVVRQRIVDILSHLGEAYGYQIHKVYVEVFGKCSRELIYYHLRRGVVNEEIMQARIKREEGKFSWGGVVEKIYYKVGRQGKPSTDDSVRTALGT